MAKTAARAGRPPAGLQEAVERDFIAYYGRPFAPDIVRNGMGMDNWRLGCNVLF